MGKAEGLVEQFILTPVDRPFTLPDSVLGGSRDDGMALEGAGLAGEGLKRSTIEMMPNGR